MKKLLVYLFVALVFLSVGVFIGRSSTTSTSLSIFATPTPVPTPLAVYSLPHLTAAQIAPAQLTRGDLTKDAPKFQSFSFTMSFDPTLARLQNKKVTGLLNIPKEQGKYPLIVMFRGYVDPSIYVSGVGTKNAAEVFASSGFLTIAPDFLGYAGSDTEAGNIFESRFQTYTTAITLLNSISTPEFNTLTEGMWDGKNIFIWAHSNGGQIALTSLAVTGEAYPTVLWAPVTKPFPYSVLYYTDESQDGGKLIRRELSKFEALYDVNEYTFTNYLSLIKAPIELNQGTADDAVPFVWSRNMAALLRKQGLDVTYNEYPGSDHNLRPAWNDVVEKDLLFYQKHLQR